MTEGEDVDVVDSFMASIQNTKTTITRRINYKIRASESHQEMLETCNVDFFSAQDTNMLAVETPRR